MILVVYGDVHWSTYSSIVRGRGEQYSIRLENCINSVQWAEELAEYVNADAVVCLGDFFDRDTLTGEELTALGEVQWAAVPHHFVVGNHEMSVADLSKSSQHTLALSAGFTIHDKPNTIQAGSKQLCFLPFQTEDQVKSISEYFPNPEPRIVFSHNNLKGIQMGRFLSDSGLDVANICRDCCLFFNGHIHNAGVVAPGVWNVGNLTGQNFSEDAERYEHIAVVVDTDNEVVTPYRNPFALQFYKVDCTSHSSPEEVCAYLSNISFSNAVVSARVKERDRQAALAFFKECSEVVEFRITVEPEQAEVTVDTRREEFSKVDYLTEFQSFIKNTLGDSLELDVELKGICK